MLAPSGNLLGLRCRQPDSGVNIVGVFCIYTFFILFFVLVPSFEVLKVVHSYVFCQIKFERNCNRLKYMITLNILGVEENI